MQSSNPYASPATCSALPPVVAPTREPNPQTPEDEKAEAFDFGFLVGLLLGVAMGGGLMTLGMVALRLVH